MDHKHLQGLTEFMRRKRRHARATEAQQEAELLSVGTFCGPDCEEEHTDEGTTCERCGSWIHKRALEVFHPDYGQVTVGSECAKDLLGWKWGKSHENALDVYQAFRDHLELLGCSIGRYFKVKPKVYMMGSPLDGVLSSASGGIKPHGPRGWLLARLPAALSGPTLRALHDLHLPLVLPAEFDEETGLRGRRDNSVIAFCDQNDRDRQLEQLHWICSADFRLPPYTSNLGLASSPNVESDPEIVGGPAATRDEALESLTEELLQMAQQSRYPDQRAGYIYEWTENERYGLIARILAIYETVESGRELRLIFSR